MKLKFYLCGHCGNLVQVLKDSNVPMMCCGQKMTELVAGTTDAAVEKHVPVYDVTDNTVHVKVGEAEHPMVEAHYIEWILLKTNQGTQLKMLSPEQKPEAVFALSEQEKVEEVYAYCNLHSLWKK